MKLSWRMSIFAQRASPQLMNHLRTWLSMNELLSSLPPVYTLPSPLAINIFVCLDSDDPSFQVSPGSTFLPQLVFSFSSCFFMFKVLVSERFKKKQEFINF